MLSDVKKFLEEYPLYSKWAVAFPQRHDQFYPEVLDLDCPTCGTVRPFRRPDTMDGVLEQLARRHTGTPASVLSLGEHRFTATCTGCKTESYQCWLELTLTPLPEGATESERHRRRGFIQKLGQRPPPSIEGKKDVLKALGGQDAELYKRALLCLSQGYGIGACAYLRRLLEHQLDPTLKLILEVMQIHGIDPEERSRIEEVIQGKDGSLKAQTAYQYAPRVIRVDGVNPLKLLYEDLSFGIHELTEDDATSVAAKRIAALEFVLPELRRQISGRSEFELRVQQLSRSRPTAKKV